MEFGSVAWLAGIAAIVVPIILHLRERQPTDVIAVGSVADIVTSPVRRQRRRLDDIPLLVLRCLIVILAALVLAAPAMRLPAEGGQRVAAIPAGADNIGDSLRAAGVRIANFSPSTNPWSMAAWADTAVHPADTLVVVFPAGATMPLTARPRVHHVVQSIVQGEAPQGIARSHLGPARAEGTSGSTPRRDLREMVWWMLFAALSCERAIAWRRAVR